MKGRAIFYTDAELAWIEARKARPRRELHAEFVVVFGRNDLSFDNFKALCARKGWKTGRTGHFRKGQTPHNKGRKMPSHHNSERTQFKPGNIPKNWRPVGHERIGKDGYIEMKVALPDPYHAGRSTRYMHKHRYLWEQKNGPVPDGHCLKSLDGDRQNTDPSNWIAIPRAMLPRLCGGRWRKPYDDYEPEARPTVLAIARLDHEARKARNPGGND